MIEKRDTDSINSRQQIEMTGISKMITALQKVYFPTATVLSCILIFLPPGNLILLAQSLQGNIMINQITGDIYTND